MDFSSRPNYTHNVKGRSFLAVSLYIFLFSASTVNVIVGWYTTCVASCSGVGLLFRPCAMVGQSHAAEVGCPAIVYLYQPLTSERYFATWRLL
jgi:hypothetical protein